MYRTFDKEHYDGDILSLFPEGEYELHFCEFSQEDFFIKKGRGCPNRRFGCDFVAQETTKLVKDDEEDV